MDSSQPQSDAHQRALFASWGCLPPEIVLRCWEDPQYLAELKNSPREVLRDAGVAVETTVEICLLENSANTTYFVVPRCPENLRHLDPKTLTPDKW
jgi:hypothetical protein